ncbi:24666_t:CDS:2 [Cetraspora pellucida]|uniref:24666_t:CDS:1 n=1 Tax=Cetraspora pellucida TaxID=1433469 RepID=A0A9N9NC18_9GLOM|nr:24666_t:CDS:2 [Cetraspora pellucida]
MALDVDKVLHFILQLLVVIQLIAVAILYVNVLPFPDPPQQKTSNLTGLPIWISDSPHFTVVNETVGIIEYVAAFITGVLAIFCVYVKLRKRPPVRVPSDDHPSNNQPAAEEILWTEMLFNTIVTGYVIVTFIALITAAIFQIGKLWAAFGIYHNVLELCLAAALLQSGAFNYIIGVIVIVVYSISAVAISSLILDFLLPALFFRLALSTHRRRKGESHPLLSNNPFDTHNLAPQSQLNCLVIAATIHLIGNLSNVLGKDMPIPTTIFNLSYFVAFPIYAYYVHQAEKDRAKYMVPKTSLYQFILLILWAASSSAIVVLTSFYRQKYNF